MRSAAIGLAALCTALWCAACDQAGPTGPTVGAGTTGADGAAAVGADSQARTDGAEPPLDQVDAAEPLDTAPAETVDTVVEAAAEVGPKPTGCASDFDCGAAGAHCVAGQCLFHTKCQSDKQCQSVGQVCDPILGECVPCAGDADCAKGTTCKGHVCLPLPQSCASTKECPNGLVCNKATSQCVLCATSADCSSNQGCLDTVCVPKVCKTAETKCIGLMTVGTCNGEGTAFEVSACGAGKHCAEGKCAVQACTPDKLDCLAAKVTKCNSAGTATTVVKDCSQQGQLCNAGQCQATQVCSPGSANCKDSQLQVCEADGTSFKKIACAKGQVCIGQACVEPVCLPGAVTCTGDKVMQCDAVGSQWSMAKNCADSGLVCKAGFCAAGCTAGMVTAAKNYPATSPFNLSAVAACSDGGWAMGGAIEGGKALLVRADSGGTKLWEKDFGWTGGYFTAVAATANGGIAAVGSLVDKNLLTCGALVLANADGSSIADLPQCESANPSAGNWVFLGITKRPDGGLYLIGFRRVGSVFTTEDFLVVRVDAAGKQIWQKTAGGTLSDRATDAVVLADDSVVAVGYSTVPVAGTSTTLGAMLTRLDAAGGPMWTKTVGTYLNSNASAVTLTKGGDLLVVGQAQAKDAKSQSWVAQYAIDGTLKWQTVVGTTLNALLVDVVTLPDGTFAAYQFMTEAAPNVLHLDASAAILHTVALPGTKDQQATQLAAAASGDMAAAVYSQYALKQPGKLMLLCGW